MAGSGGTALADAPLADAIAAAAQGSVAAPRVAATPLPAPGTGSEAPRSTRSMSARLVS